MRDNRTRSIITYNLKGVDLGTAKQDIENAGGEIIHLLERYEMISALISPDTRKELVDSGYNVREARRVNFCT